jgi:peptide/nickel transport system substrate-binding protein
VYEGHADAAQGIYGPASAWAARRPAPNPSARPGAVAGQQIVLATYSDRAELPEVASTIAEGLRRKGFVVDQVVREYSLLEPDLLAGAFDAVVATRSYLLDTGDPGTFLASDLTCGGSYNLSRLCDAGVDSAVEAIGGEVDVDARRVASLKAEAAVLATGALVPLVHERSRIGVATGVLGVPSDPYERRVVTRETRRP